MTYANHKSLFEYFTASWWREIETVRLTVLVTNILILRLENSTFASPLSFVQQIQLIILNNKMLLMY